VGCECGECATCDAETAEAHEALSERCECDSCTRVASAYARVAREREAALRGGLSSWGQQALGLEGETTIMDSWKLETMHCGTYYVDVFRTGMAIATRVQGNTRTALGTFKTAAEAMRACQAARDEVLFSSKAV
jgi:hypothetical protein